VAGAVCLQPPVAPADGRDRALALLVGAERGHDLEPSAIFLRAPARRFRRRCRPRRAGTAACAWRLVLVGLEGRPRAQPCRRRAVLAEALLGLLLRLHLGLEVVFAALLFVGLARLGGLAFGALGGLAHTADQGLLF